MGIDYKKKGWKLEASGDGKSHYITGPKGCVLSIEIDTDDYEEGTEEQMRKLVDLLAAHWTE